MADKNDYDKLMADLCPMLCNCADCYDGNFDSCVPGRPIYDMQQESYGAFVLGVYDEKTNAKIKAVANRHGWLTRQDESGILFEKKKVCYFVGPDTEDCFDKLEQYERRIKEELGFETINPLRIRAMLPECIPQEGYICLEEMLFSFCDSVFFMPGWEESDKIRPKYAWAIAHGMELFTEQADGKIGRMCS